MSLVRNVISRRFGVQVVTASSCKSVAVSAIQRPRATIALEARVAYVDLVGGGRWLVASGW